MNSVTDIMNIISIWSQGGAEITVTYEALDAAAGEVLQRACRLEETCDQLNTLCGKMASYWDSEAREMNESVMREQIEQIQTLAMRFRKHAENLQSIAANYLNASGKAASRIEGLSPDVIL